MLLPFSCHFAYYSGSFPSWSKYLGEDEDCIKEPPQKYNAENHATFMKSIRDRMASTEKIKYRSHIIMCPIFSIYLTLAVKMEREAR